MKHEARMTGNYIARFWSVSDLVIRISFVIRYSDFVIQRRSSLRFQHLNERFLRNVDFPDAFHPFFSFFLFLQ